MNKLLILAALLITTSVSAHSRELRALAKDEYQTCLRETATARRECSFGGCGNILGRCYERQINVFESDSLTVSEALSKGPCAASSAKVNDELAQLESSLLGISRFDNTWAGFELRVELAATKNKSLHLLASECSPAKRKG